MRAFRWAWVLAAVTGCALAWAADGAAQSHACPTFTPPPLPEAKEGASYSVKVMSGPGVRQVKFAPPQALTFNDSVVAGVPARPGTYSFEYKVTLNYTCAGFYSDGGKWSRTESHRITVHDVTPPQITSFTASPNEMTASGGTLTVELKGIDNFGVAKAVLSTKHPDGHTGSSFMHQTGGYAIPPTAPLTPAASTWTQKIEIPINTEPTPVVWTFIVNAYDPEGNGVKGGPIMVRVAGRSTEGLIKPPPIRR